MHRHINRGSLWLGSKRAGEYGVLANGDVRPILHDLLNRYVDPAIGTDYEDYVIRRKGLVIPTIDEIANIIKWLGESHYTRNTYASQQINTHGAQPSLSHLWAKPHGCGMLDLSDIRGECTVYIVSFIARDVQSSVG